MKPFNNVLKSTLLVCTIAIIASLDTGCATTRVHAGDSSEFTENTCTHCDTVVWAYWWGFKQPRIEALCTEKSMSEVKVQTHFGHALITVFSLGIAMPQHITWICAGIDEPTGLPGQ